MRLIIDAIRWDETIDSKAFSPEGVKELRLVQREDGWITVYVDGESAPSIAVEPNYHGGGERLFIYGDNEEEDSSYYTIR